METNLIVILNIISAWSILFLLALGLKIVFGLMGIVNLAHGHFIMLGAYAAYFTMELGLSIWLTLIFPPLFLAVVGLITERLLIRPLYGKIMESILATWGLGIVLTQIVEMIFGKGFKSMSVPIESTVSVLGVNYSLYRLLIIAFAVFMVIFLIFIERKTNLGVTVRAVIANPTLASTLGININRVYQVTFVVGSVLAGIAGVIIAPLVSVFPNMGLGLIINAFLAVLVSGPGAIMGLVGSAALLGGSESLVSYWLNPVWGSIIVILIAMITMRLQKENRG